MFKNIFNKKSQACCEYTITRADKSDLSFNESDLLEFLVLQEMNITQATMENVRYIHLGEKEKSIEIIQESVSDFFDKMVEFFKNLLEKIRSFFSKMFLYIQTLMGNTEGLIKTAGSSMTKKNASFIIQGYTYTIKDSSPNLKYLDNLVSEYNKEYASINKMKLEDITSRRKEAMDNMSKLRGEILGVQTHIDPSDFKNEVHKFFRNGDDTPSDITVDASYIETITQEYSNLRKTYNECVIQKRKLEVQLEGLKKFFEIGAREIRFIDGEKKKVNKQISLTDNGISPKKDSEISYYTSSDVLKVTNAYFNYRFAESKELSNIILTVITTKTQALKEQLKQYDTCIRKWIYVKPETNESREGEK